jgi:F420-non-reducing hydrogenase iron-sulfur subunit
MKNIFEPSILAFCCQYCSYNAADLAGSMRIQYPANVKIIFIPCTGRVDIIHVLNAIEKGADGVFLSGCEIDGCHFISGNIKAAKRITRVKRILEDVGIEPARVEMFYNAASMGPQFAETCIKFTETIRALGPIYGYRKARFIQKALGSESLSDVQVF